MVSHPFIKVTNNQDYNLLRFLAINPNLPQRKAAEELGISLGKYNYILSALISKGLVKIQNFKNSKNKISYAYLLTPKGIEESARLTMEYYEIKKREFEEIEKEILKLKINDT